LPSLGLAFEGEAARMGGDPAETAPAVPIRCGRMDHRPRGLDIRPRRLRM